VTLLTGSYEPRFIEKYLIGGHPLGSVYNEGAVSPSRGLERHSIVSELLKRFSLNVLLTIYRLLSSGRLRPVIYSEVFPLERITTGLEALESRKSWGKVVVRVRDDKSEQAAFQAKL